MKPRLPLIVLAVTVLAATAHAEIVFSVEGKVMLYLQATASTQRQPFAYNCHILVVTIYPPIIVHVCKSQVSHFIPVEGNVEISIPAKFLIDIDA